MRPIRRNDSPVEEDFDDYTKAKPELISRLGNYCSYCERPIATNLAVEHIQPKDGKHGRPELAGRWSNFLLACVNCNSTKSDKLVELDKLLLPDRDNTSVAYVYREDGVVDVSPELSDEKKSLAIKTLSLVGLDKRTSRVLDINGKLVAIDRFSQRMEAWLLAEQSKIDLEEFDEPVMRKQIVRTAVCSGFFSVWMSVFRDDEDMRLRLIKAYQGTCDSGCFDSVDSCTVSPAPNPDGLESGGKI